MTDPRPIPDPAEREPEMSGRKIIEGLQEAIDLVKGENDFIAEAITEQYGERCPDFDPACYCCQAWAQYDALKGGDASAERGAIAEWSYRNPTIPWAAVSEAGKQQYISMARRIIEAAKEE